MSVLFLRWNEIIYNDHPRFTLHDRVKPSFPGFCLGGGGVESDSIEAAKRNLLARD